MNDKRGSGTVHIGAALQDFLKHNGSKQRVDAQQVILEWDSAVGAHLAKSATPLKIANGILTLRARNAVWRTELLMRQTELVTKINDYFKQELVTHVVVI